MNKKYMIIPETKKGAGAFIDRKDNRDYPYAEISAGVSPFNWNVGYDIEKELSVILSNPSFTINAKDQDGSGSCGGQAWGYYNGVQEAVQTKTYEERSARFIYAQTYVPGGGSGGRENSIICTTQGVARESVLTSYDNGKAPTEGFMERTSDITTAVRFDASKSKAMTFFSIEGIVDKLAEAIRDNHGIVIGIAGVNNGTWYSSFPEPPTANTAGPNVWRHWLYCGKAKLVNGVKHIGALNSWGSDVGDKGWQWFSESHFTRYISSLYGDGAGGKVVWAGWVITYNNNPVPPSFKHTFNTPLKLKQTGEEVRALQMALQLDGSFSAGIDLSPAKYPSPLYGEITRQAVLKFQRKYKVAPDSELISLNGELVGPATRSKLNQLFA